MKISMVIIQVFLLVLIAPLISGVIRKMKNNLRMRIGAGIFQPYFNLIKLFAKDEVVSSRSSWIFHAAPYIVLSSAITALALIPAVSAQVSASGMGDLLAIIFLLALGRFFLALSALDTGSPFGGMGSSREMFISSVVEPVIILAAFAVGALCGSTSLEAMNAPAGITLSRIAAGIALFLASLAETSRLPVDNQETHLELTMIHEAMVLEYSGRSLALIELASQVKQLIFFLLIGTIVVPAGYLAGMSTLAACAVLVAKIAVLCVIVSLCEVSVAKLRLFRVVDFLGVGFLFAVVSFIFVLMKI